MENLPNEGSHLKNEAFPSTTPILNQDSDVEKKKFQSHITKTPFLYIYTFLFTFLIFSFIVLLYFLILYPYRSLILTYNKDFTKPITSRTQSHQIIKLSNGIEVLLISDISTIKCSASLTVGAGSFLDTNSIQGLAHLTEHVISLSKNDLSNHINKYLGNFSSFTEAEKTTFYYDVNANGFIHSVMLFAKMFSSLSFNSTHIENAVKIIDIEYESKLNKDEWKENQILKYFSNQKHPFNQFSDGNKETILTNNSNNYTFLQTEITKFFNAYYTPDNMRLVLYSNLDLKSMKDMASQFFNSIESNSEYPSSHEIRSSSEIAYRYEEKAKWIWYETVSSLPVADIVFILDGIKTYEDIKPLDYITYMLNFGGEGSLVKYLKDKKMITKFETKLISSFKSFCIYSISITPTEYGKHNLYPLIDSVFAFINELKNYPVNETLFNEIATISDIEFKFMEKEKNIKEYVSTLSSRMFEYQNLYSEILSGKYLHSKFNKEVITKFLNLLSPSNTIFLIGGGFFPPDDYLVETIFEHNEEGYEPYYKTRYMSSKIHNDVIEILKNESTFDNKIVNFNFSMRNDNQFITTKKNNVQCVDEDRYFSSKCKDEFDYYNPTKYTNDNLTKINIWYRLDRTYNVPKTVTYIHLVSKLTRGNMAVAFALNIYYYYLQNQFSAAFYDLIDSKGQIELTFDNNGFLIVIESYSDLTEKILGKVVDIFVNDTLFLGEKKYNDFYDYVIEIIQMRKNNEPSMKTYEIFNKIIKTNVTLISEIEQIIKKQYKLSYKKYRNIIDTFKKSLFINSLFYGDVGKEDIKKFKFTLAHLIPEQNESDSNNTNITSILSFLSTHSNETGSFIVKVPNDLPYEHNDIVDNYYSICSLNNITAFTAITVMKAIWSNLLAISFLNENQLAFSVIDEIKIIDNNVYLRLGVIGNKKSIDEINKDIDQVLLQIQQKIDDITSNEFTMIISLLKKELKTRESNLKERSMSAWDEIYMNNLNFERKEQIIKDIDNLTIEDIANWFNYLFISNVKKISVQLYTQKNYENEKEKFRDEEEYLLNKTIKSKIIYQK